jgi:butyrate kinase
LETKYKVFTINPGSTSTKIALFENREKVFAANVAHDAQALKDFKDIPEQLPYRKAVIQKELDKHNISLDPVDAVVGRCGGIEPLAGGVYAINDLILAHSMAGRVTKHPANLGAQLAHDFAAPSGAPTFIVNPPDTDELQPIARVSGLHEIFRISKGHPLNQKEVGIRHAASLGRRYEDLNLVISHIGGGISVTAHEKGRMIDTTNCIDGDGTMAPTRAGGVAAVTLIKMCFSGRYTEREMYDRITKTGGLVDHLGTSDAREIKARIDSGDGYAKLIYDAMIYQVCKDIGAYATVLCGDVDAILLTGGISNDTYLVDQITSRVNYIAPVIAYAGEFEMEAMAAGAIRVLSGEESPQIYTGEPVWKGFESNQRN